MPEKVRRDPWGADLTVCDHTDCPPSCPVWENEQYMRDVEREARRE